MKSSPKDSWQLLILRQCVCCRKHGRRIATTVGIVKHYTIFHDPLCPFWKILILSGPSGALLELNRENCNDAELTFSWIPHWFTKITPSSISRCHRMWWYWEFRSNSAKVFRLWILYFGCRKLSDPLPRSGAGYSRSGTHRTGLDGACGTQTTPKWAKYRLLLQIPGSYPSTPPAYALHLTEWASPVGSPDRAGRGQVVHCVGA